MLFDIRRLAWDAELCELLGVDPARLPEPLPSAHVFGTTTEFGGEVPVAGIAGDQQAALFGQACHRPGMAKNTYGTGSFVLLNTGARGAARRPTGCSPRSPGGSASEVAYALEASIFVTGAAVQWLRDGLGIIDEAGETEALAASLDVQRRRLLRPGADRARLAALGPLRARHDRRPHPRQRPRPPGAGGAGGDRLPDGRRGARPGGRLPASGCELLKADGGAVANRWLMQFQADVLGAPVVVPEIAETTALGAAYLAGIATGRWTREQVGEMWREAARYEPRMGEDERESLLADWRRALERSRNWASEPPAVAVVGRRHGCEMKPQVYKDPRPAEYFTQFHDARAPQGRRLDLHASPASSSPCRRC